MGAVEGQVFSSQCMMVLVQLTILEDPENMVTMLDTWQSADCSNQDHYKGSKLVH